MSRNPITELCLLVAICAGMLALSACETAVNPILESDRNFTLFGTLDMGRDTQFVRVTPIRAALDPGAPSPLEATVTSVDMQTGERIVWSDSILIFDNGTFGHVFYAPLRIQAARRYRLEVRAEGSDVVTSAETLVPIAPKPVVLPEVVTSTVTGAGIVVRGSQEVRWEGVGERPVRVEQWYRFVMSDRLPFLDVLIPLEPSNSVDPEDVRTWRVVLNLAHDRAVLDTMVNVKGAALAGLGQQIIVMDEAFRPPGGVFDPEILAQPGYRSNVQNGFGYVGAVGRFRTEWTLDPLSVDRLGYLDMGDLFGGSMPEAIRPSQGPRHQDRHHNALRLLRTTTSSGMP